MTKLYGSILPSILILTFIVIFISCGCKANKTEEQIIGKWELSEELDNKGIRIPDYIEFFSDGSVQSQWGGKYSIDGEKLNIYYAAMDSYSYTFKINNNTLTLKSDIDAYNNDETEYIYFRSGSEKDKKNQDDADEKETEPMLSASCDAVLAEGTDINGDYYELVATQKDTYNSVEIKVGVIKNNKWLVELSSNNPFIDKESGLFWSYNDYYAYTYHYCTAGIGESGSYEFIGNGCFYHEGTFYNANTQKYYKDGYVSDGEMHALPNKYTIPYTFFDNSENVEIGQRITDAENIIIETKQDDSDLLELLNTSTMETTVIGNRMDYQVGAPFSEDLFFGAKDDKYAFFNSNGEEMINLSEYDIVTYYIEDQFECIFIDGKAVIRVMNDAGKCFKITIDKSGNVISQELIEDNTY